MTDDLNRRLFAEHIRELTSASAIDPAVIIERGYESLSRPTAADQTTVRNRLRRAGIPNWATDEDRYFPGLLLPLWGPSGAHAGHQFKPRTTVINRGGKKMKYASATGRSSVLDVHPRWTIGSNDIVPAIRDTSRPLWITEGVKKADSLTSRGCVTVALNGVYNWRSSHGTLGDWEDVPLKGRDVVVCFDSDALDNATVLRAMQRLGAWLKTKQVAKVLFVTPPPEHAGKPTKGVDDYFAAGGTVPELLQRATTTPPRPPSHEDPFTESALAELIAAEVYDEHLVHVANVAWFRYNGKVWVEVEDGAAIEAVREYFRDRYRAALQEEADKIRRGEPIVGDDVEKWRSLQAKKKIDNVVALAKNITGVAAVISEFDTHHDLLNTPDGVLDLRTLETAPHDPSYRFTKITKVSFVPGAESLDLKTALEAVPEDATDWLQVRMGQAITGYEPDDDRLLMFQGIGENGKTVILGGIRDVLGGYAAAIPSSLLLSSKNQSGPSPEKMTLQGVRMGYMEETAEGRHLDITALKQVVGNRTITARQLHKKYVEFSTTHSLFLNVNPLPEVRDTDSGTWRRLLRVPFPYRFRKKHEPLEKDTDRRGDPGIKRRMLERPTRENQEAILAWLVIGANAWYRDDQDLAAMPVPKSVQAATDEWRAYADPIIRFMLTHTRARRGSWIDLTEFVAALSNWMLDQRLQPGGSNMLQRRVKDHSGLPHGTAAKRFRPRGASPSRYVTGTYTGVAPPKVPEMVTGLVDIEWLPLDERS